MRDGADSTFQATPKNLEVLFDAAFVVSAAFPSVADFANAATTGDVQVTAAALCCWMSSPFALEELLKRGAKIEPWFLEGPSQQCRDVLIRHVHKHSSSEERGRFLAAVSQQEIFNATVKERESRVVTDRDELAALTQKISDLVANRHSVALK